MADNEELVERLSQRRGRLSVFYMQAERDEEPNPGTLASIIDVLQHIDSDQREYIGNQATLIEQLHKEVARLRGALEPFAKAGELFHGPPTDFDQCIYAPAAGDEYALSGNHLRQARAALTGEHNG